MTRNPSSIGLLPIGEGLNVSCAAKPRAASTRSVGRQTDGRLYRIIIFTIFIFMSSKGGLRTGSSNQVPLRSVDL